MKIVKKFCFVLLCLFSLSIATDSEVDDATIDSNTESTVSESVDLTPPKEFEIVALENFGEIKGFLEKSSNGNYFYSFLGIPYAKPPTGTRRFKNPEVTEGWEGVRDGSIAPPPCSQIDLDTFIKQPKSSYVGEEDCLYLNIYTPEPNPSYADLPVLVYFHGGNFVSGSASDYEPYDILDAPVILVVLQYRLGVLGFLSTEDDVIPGNFGLKDQTLALKWLHRYIEQFGGSPLKITLFGSDAGAASVHYQTLTHRTIGLFNRAILQSGNALCPWAIGGVHKEAAHHIGKYFKCFPEEESEEKLKEDDNKQEEVKETEEDQNNSQREENENQKDEEVAESNTNGENNSDNKDDKDKEKDKEEGKEENEKSETQIKNEKLLECLQNIEVDKLALSVELFYMWSYFPVIFGPYTDEKYLAESPESLLLNGRHKRLDLIVGINKDDGSHITNSLFMSEGRRMALKHHFPLVGPISLEFSDDDVAPLNMSIKAYDKYAGGLTAEAADAQNLTKLYTDRHFAVCTDTIADLHSTNNQRQRQKKNVYFYEFDYRGERSTADGFGLNIGDDWISHGDELFYLFPFNKTKDHFRNEQDEKMKKLIVKMWYYFAETGNPTPNGTAEFTWGTYTVENRTHLHLGATPYMEEDKRVETREFWNSLPTRQNIYLNKEYFLQLLNRTDMKDNKMEDNDNKEEIKVVKITEDLYKNGRSNEDDEENKKNKDNNDIKKNINDGREEL